MRLVRRTLGGTCAALSTNGAAVSIIGPDSALVVMRSTCAHHAAATADTSVPAFAVAPFRSRTASVVSNADTESMTSTTSGPHRSMISSRTSGVMLSAGCRPMSSTSSTSPWFPMAGSVVNISATSTRPSLSAARVSGPPASSVTICPNVRPYVLVNPTRQSSRVRHSGGPAEGQLIVHVNEVADASSDRAGSAVDSVTTNVLLSSAGAASSATIGSPRTARTSPACMSAASLVDSDIAEAVELRSRTGVLRDELDEAGRQRRPDELAGTEAERPAARCSRLLRDPGCTPRRQRRSRRNRTSRP